MKKLLDHFEAMQEQATGYLQTPPAGVSPAEQQGRFIGAMLEALDGPAQREAQAEAEASVRDYDALLGVECDTERQRAFWEAVEDVKSHAGDFRNALSMARDNAEPATEDQADPAYWQHQLDALSRILKGLDYVSAPGDRSLDLPGDTFDPEEAAAGQDVFSARPDYDANVSLNAVDNFPDEPFPGVDPAPGKLSSTI